jgi:hypothetical protein
MEEGMKECGLMGNSMEKEFISRPRQREGKESGGKARGLSGWMRIRTRIYIHFNRNTKKRDLILIF